MICRRLPINLSPFQYRVFEPGVLLGQLAGFGKLLKCEWRVTIASVNMFGVIELLMIYDENKDRNIFSG